MTEKWISASPRNPIFEPFSGHFYHSSAIFLHFPAHIEQWGPGNLAALHWSCVTQPHCLEVWWQLVWCREPGLGSRDPLAHQASWHSCGGDSGECPHWSHDEVDELELDHDKPDLDHMDSEEDVEVVATVAEGKVPGFFWNAARQCWQIALPSGLVMDVPAASVGEEQKSKTKVSVGEEHWELAQRPRFTDTERTRSHHDNCTPRARPCRIFQMGFVYANEKVSGRLWLESQQKRTNAFEDWYEPTPQETIWQDIYQIVSFQLRLGGSMVCPCFALAMCFSAVNVWTTHLQTHQESVP